MPHHLAKRFNRHALRQANRCRKAKTAHMEGQAFVYLCRFGKPFELPVHVDMRLQPENPAVRTRKFRILISIENLNGNIQKRDIRSSSRLLTVQDNPQATVFHCVDIRVFQVFQINECDARECAKNKHVAREIPCRMFGLHLHQPFDFVIRQPRAFGNNPFGNEIEKRLSR